MLELLFFILLIWGSYCAMRTRNREFITITSFFCFFVYYILGGVLFSDDYFPYLVEKNYSFDVFFPAMLLSILLASIIGNFLILTIPANMSFSVNRDFNPVGLYVVALFYTCIILLYVIKSGFGVFSEALSVSENVTTRTSLVYESSLYSYVSYAAFYVLPFVSLILLLRGDRFAPALFLALCVLAISITGQKSSLVLILATFFFYLCYEYGFWKALKLISIPAVLSLALLLFIVISWNRDSLTGDFYSNVFLAAKGVFERVTLVGSRLVSEYIHITDTIRIELDMKPEGLPFSMFVYDVIEGDGLKGSKPAHVSMIMYFKWGLLASCIATFLLYVSYFLIKLIGDHYLIDRKINVATNIWILVSIINATITDSFMYLSAWLFSIMAILGAIIVFASAGNMVRGQASVMVPFKSILINLLAVISFLYLFQGLVRGLL